jgi:hypothetical protein
MTSLHKLPKHKAETASAADLPDGALFEGLDVRTTALVIIALGVIIFLLEYM